MENLKVCRLCLQIISNSSLVISESFENKLKFILPDLYFQNSEAISDPELCSACTTNLQSAYEFKSKCLNSNSFIKNEFKRSQNVIDHLLLDSCSKKQRQVCQFCLKLTDTETTETFPLLKDILSDKFFMVFDKYLKELEPELSKTFVVCQDCSTSLQHHLDFISACLDAENIIQQAVVKVIGKTSLYKILQFQSLSHINTAVFSGNVPHELQSAENDYNSVIVKTELKDEYDDNFVDTSKVEPEMIVKEEIDTQIELSDNLITFENSAPIYWCEQCEFKSTNKSTIKRHQIVHQMPEEVTMFKCEQCPFQTKYKKSIETHLFIHKTPDEVTMLNCAHCSYSTKMKRYLMKHLESHRSQTPEEIVWHYCELCAFKSKRKDVLKQHSIVHKNSDEVLIFSCELCPYVGKRKGHLKDHMLTHKNEEDVFIYKCEHCPYQSKYKNSLKAHKTNHEDPNEIQMHKCGQCSYESKYKTHLKRHREIHNSEENKKNKCDQCPFMSKSKSNLNKHMEFHKSSDEVPYHKCELCSYQTRNKNGLKKHKLTHSEYAV